MVVGANRGQLPLIVFGAPEDISASPWTDLGTSPGVTGSQADPLGGTDAYLITDNDAASAEGRRSESFVLNEAVSSVALFMKAGTAAASEFILRDITGAANKVIGRVTWTGPTLSVSAGTGTAFDLISLGNSWYLAIISGITTVAGNSHQFWVYGATSSATSVGTTIYFLSNCLVPGLHLDQAKAMGMPSDGSRWIHGTTGVEEAWITGTDQYLKGVIRWIPAELTQLPHVATGWNGDNEFTGVDVGWDDFLNTWARDKQTFAWVPKRSAASSNVVSYLVEPMEGEPELEDDFSYRLAIELRSSTGAKYKGY